MFRRTARASLLGLLRPATVAPVRAARVTAYDTRPWTTLGPDPRMAPATRIFLDRLRIAMSVADGEASPGSGRGSAAAAGFVPGSEPSDFQRVSALVELAQKGDAEAFGQLYERYVDTVYRYIYVRVGNVHLAQDLTSETFLRALRRLDSFSWQGRDIAAWFVTIARNLVTDNARCARFRLDVSTADLLDADQRVDSPETAVLDRLRDERLLRAVGTLKPEQAECIVLRFLQGLSLAETAKILGRTEGAVKQLQLRAVRALHRELGEDEL